MKGFRKYLDVHLWNSSNDLRRARLVGPADLHRHQRVVLFGAALDFQNLVHEPHDVPVDGSAEGDRGDAGGGELVGVGDKLVIGLSAGLVMPAFSNSALL